MSTELIISCIGIVSTVVGSWSGWFFGRKKNEAETNTILIQNMQKSLDFYKTIIEDNNEKLQSYINENNKTNTILEENQKMIYNMREVLIRVLNSTCIKTCDDRETYTQNQIQNMIDGTKVKFSPKE